MKPFHTIAVPHRDILEGRLTMDVFAADLWEVFKGRGADEYKDQKLFFQKTYQTEGLQHLSAIVEKRLQGQGGDPVIQLQTPFGGGKTHALIALYHQAEEWQAKRVVISGDKLNTSQTFWGLLEEQLTDQIERCKEPVAPGGEVLRQILIAHQPVLILMDEVLEYVTKAAGVRVVESTLAAQTLAFMQELSEAASTMEQVSLVVTLPSSSLEHYDEQAEKLFAQLQKIVGRVEKIYTPVQDHEITAVIRQRLFSDIDRTAVRAAVGEFMEYALKESILPAGTEPSTYRKRFEASYPFLPEVVNILYHRWGSFPKFQRTRGVLQLLSQVTSAHKEAPIPYLSLADFDLAVQDIRRYLLKYTGAEFDSVIAADITGAEAGAKKVNTSVGNTYKGLKLGTRATTTIFLYSFSGGLERGASAGEIKRHAIIPGTPAGVIGDALEQSKNRLFYLQHQYDRYYFTTQPNLNRMLLTKMENVDDEALEELEENLLKKGLAGNPLNVFRWIERDPQAPDDMALKLIILKDRDDTFMRQVLTMKGSTPRVNRNTIFFLMPSESDRIWFRELLKKSLAYSMILADKHFNLSDEQRKEVESKWKKVNSDLDDAVRRYYRLLLVPGKQDEFKERDLGIPTHGERKKIDEKVYDRLKAEGDIVENMAALVIKERYLTDKPFLSTEQLFKSSATTPGEVRVTGKLAWERGIRDGVRTGLFGLGMVENDKLVCRFYQQEISSPIDFSGSEIIIRADLCVLPEAEAQKTPEGYSSEEKEGQKQSPIVNDFTPGAPTSTPAQSQPPQGDVRDYVHLRFTVPKGKISSLMGMMNLLQRKFNTLTLDLQAEGGSMTEQEYELNIEETLQQLGIKLDE